jgi:hypothetical protein
LPAILSFAAPRVNGQQREPGTFALLAGAAIRWSRASIRINQRASGHTGPAARR